MTRINLPRETLEAAAHWCDMIAAASSVALWVEEAQQTADALRAALAQAPEQPQPGAGWLPIESAPRDGTKLCLAELTEDGKWIFWQDYWRQYHPPFGAGFGEPRNPSLWQPLPAPPPAQ